MRNTIVILLLSLLAAACTKDKFTTKPQLKYKTVSSNVVASNQIFEMKLSFTDLEGDLTDTIFIEKIATNCSASFLKLKYKFPIVPGDKITEGDLAVTFANGIDVPIQYQNLSIAPRCDDNDTCFFRFVIKDKAQNYSDTVTSETIVLLKN